MKLHFYLRYRTKHGQNLALEILNENSNEKNGSRVLPMNYLNEDFWYLTYETAAPELEYRYLLDDEQGGPGGTPTRKTEWSNRKIELATADDWQVFDFWNPTGAYENAFLTQPFKNFLLKNEAADAAKTAKPAKNFSHIFKVKAPLLKANEVPCLLGHGVVLRDWDSAAPLLLTKNAGSDDWETRLDFSKEEFPLAYKYGIWNTKKNKFVQFETGSNRSLFEPPTHSKTILNDGFLRVPNDTWRGVGVAIPVFSLRSERSFGVGEFSDLMLLADWARAVGLKLIQLLPINDTSATGTWTDSYPYAAISAFALHPIYLNLSEVAGKKHASILKPFLKKQPALNALEAVDYEAVLTEKWAAARLLFETMKHDWAANAAWQQHFAENKSWLLPYAVFCFLKEKNGTADFNSWASEHQKFDLKKAEKMATAGSKDADAIALHLFVQWHLHLQLKAATDYIHQKGLVVKGDIPIGIYRYSCDAWVAPELYNMDKQAGAPPDDFAEAGQNWGFPTYNWQRMQADGFAWWRQRFEQMSLYFDAFRIDHILGFFRIWSIPLDAVEGILGLFVPALPVEEFELREAGVPLARLTEPFISDSIVNQAFGENSLLVAETFLERKTDGLWQFKPEFSSQKQVEATDFSKNKLLSKLDAATQAGIRKGLFGLLANVILLRNSTDGSLHFRFGIEKTSSFQNLGGWQQQFLKNLYNHYFFRRQDDFWQTEAMEKLPSLKRSTNMLICGEDLGMVPACVPDVMQELGILSLEIQRMPKQLGATFFNPKDAPYLSVVTPSTHDMSTVRGWWEEDRGLTQRFYNEVMGIPNDAPYYCEAWVNQAIVAQHLNSPAMWAIFQLQDLMGIDADLRRENPHDERINLPSNPKHYWRYRMHLSLEDLSLEERFCSLFSSLVRLSGR